MLKFKLISQQIAKCFHPTRFIERIDFFLQTNSAIRKIMKFSPKQILIFYIRIISQVRLFLNLFVHQFVR